jgi:hypothetical protein
MPLRHEDTNPDSYRDHKELIFNELALVKLCAFVPPPVPDGTFGRVGGNKSTFQSGLIIIASN